MRSRPFAIAIGLACALGSCHALGRAQPAVRPVSAAGSVDGDWLVTESTPMGERSMHMSFALEGERLSITTRGDAGAEQIQGVYRDGVGRWSIPVTIRTPTTLEVQAIWSGDRMTGEAKVGSFGAGALNGQRLGPVEGSARCTKILSRPPPPREPPGSDGDVAASGATSTRAPARQGALQKPLTPSPQLAAVIGPGPASRGETVFRIWDYVKRNQLQNPTNRREIVADQKLKALFCGKEKVSIFEMNRFLAMHLW